MKKTHTRGTQSIQRAALLIQVVAESNREGIRLVDLARGLRIERPTIYRILRSLVEEKFIAQDPVSKRYFLGEALFEFGLTAARRFNPRDLCQPILDRFADVTGDTVYLNIRSGNQAVCLYRKTGSFPIKVLTLEVGDRRPLGAGAGGLAILSTLPEEELPVLIKDIDSTIPLHGWKRLTAANLTAAVERTLEQGYAIHHGEFADVRAIGVAIKGKSGIPFAAVSMAAISSRISGGRIDELVKLLKHAAAEIESLICHHDLADWNT